MARRQKPARSADPLVPIYSPHLRAAIQDQKLSVAAAARRLKESQQTLAHLAMGDGIKRCRRSRRARLARMLHVSEEFLSAPAVQVLPIYSPTDHTVALTGGLGLESPRVQLALGRLLRRCVETCDRDLSEPSLGEVGDLPSVRDKIRNNLARCIRTLADVDDWRDAIMVGVESPWWGIFKDGTMMRSRRLPTDPEEEGARLELIAAWEQLLEPWFAEKAKLNYRSVRARAGFPPAPGDTRPDTNPRILENML